MSMLDKGEHQEVGKPMGKIKHVVDLRLCGTVENDNKTKEK